MRIEVVGKDLQVGDEIRVHAEEKGAKLPTFFDGTQLVRFTLSKADPKGFRSECIVDVEKHDDFVATAEAPDLRKAVDESVAKATRQLTDFKEKLKQARR